MEYLRAVEDALAYMEAHKHERVTLERIARAACYSPCHLHRVFRDALGMTVHDYMRRRRLTEAARLLTRTDWPIAEIALRVGYGSQQALSDAFRPLYKCAPAAYRKAGRFYPLQLRLHVTRMPGERLEARQIARAEPRDIPALMALARSAVDGYPHWEENEFADSLSRHIAAGGAWLLRDGERLAGAMLLGREAGRMDYLAAHPQYRRVRAEQVLVRALMDGLPAEACVSITTFRAGDRADTGYREAYRRMGFAPAETLREFGYPTQRLVLAGARR